MKDDKKSSVYGYIMAAAGALIVIVSFFMDNNKTAFFMLGIIFVVLGLTATVNDEQKSKK